LVNTILYRFTVRLVLTQARLVYTVNWFLQLRPSTCHSAPLLQACAMATILLLLLLLPLLLLLHHLYSRRRPPGPPSLPLLGSLPFLSTAKGLLDWTLDPQVTKNRLSTVWLGPIPVYIINCPSLVKKLFDMEEFSGRKVPDWIAPLRYSRGGLGVINSSGSQWVTHRRFSIRTLKDFGLGRQSLEETIHFEVMELIEQFFDRPGDLLLSEHFNVPIINVLWQMLASSRFDLSKPKDAKLMEAVRDIFDNGLKTDFCPLFIAKLFPKSSGLARMTEVCVELNEYLGDVIKQHSEELDPDHPKDFIDVYLVEMGKNDQVFNTEELINCIWDFFLAGTETSSTTLKWAVLYLTLHPEVQQRCREEIQEVVGEGRLAVAHLPSLPYLQATIAEVQRMSRVAPLTLPHYTTAPTTADSFTFPPNSMFFANLSFIMNDPKHFKDPHVFRPERFLSSEGRYVKDDRVMPFSVGKRYCMGDQLARSEVFLFLGSLLQEVQLLPPKDHPSSSPSLYAASFTRIPNDFYLSTNRLTR